MITLQGSNCCCTKDLTTIDNKNGLRRINGLQVGPTQGAPVLNGAKLGSMHGHLTQLHQHSHHNQTKLYQPCTHPDLNPKASHLSHMDVSPVPQNAYSPSTLKQRQQPFLGPDP